MSFTANLHRTKPYWGLIFVALLMTAGLISLSIVNQGYEGTRLYLVAVRVNGETYYYGGDKPPEASVWELQPDTANLDPDGENTGLQNLIVSVDTVGYPERWRGPGSEPEYDSYQWTIDLADGRKKLVDAKIYYFKHEVTLQTSVDEAEFILGYFQSERASPWTDFYLFFEASAYEMPVEGNLTEESFTAVLGVEIVKMWWADPGENMDGVTAFHGGQMVTLIDPETNLIFNPPDIGSLTGYSDPQKDMFRNKVYFPLHFRKFGVSASHFESFRPGILVVELRVHVLKLDKFILLRTIDTPYQPPINTESGDGLLPFLDGVSLANPLEAIDNLLSNMSNAVRIALYIGFLVAGLIASYIIYRILVGKPVWR